MRLFLLTLLLAGPGCATPTLGHDPAELLAVRDLRAP